MDFPSVGTGERGSSNTACDCDLHIGSAKDNRRVAILYANHSDAPKHEHISDTHDATFCESGMSISEEAAAASSRALKSNIVSSSVGVSVPSGALHSMSAFYICT